MKYMWFDITAQNIVVIVKGFFQCKQTYRCQHEGINGQRYIDMPILFYLYFLFVRN